MTKRFFVCFLAFAMVVGLFPSVFSTTDNRTYASTSFGGGAGTQADPYLISSGAHLQQLSTLAATEDPYYVKLAQDIDVEDVTWSPINNNQPKFHFDGDGKKILNLTVDQSSSSYVGLFHTLYEGQSVHNLTVEVNRMVGDRYVGAIAGENRGQIINSHAQGAEETSFIRGNGDEIGGLVGKNIASGTITHSSSSIEIQSADNATKIGGLVGFNAGTIKNSSASGRLSLKNVTTVGGLVGQNEGLIFGSFATVSNHHDPETLMGYGISVFGGLVGLHSTYEPTARIAYSYATGQFKVSRVSIHTPRSEQIGGLVGSMYGGVIDHSYSLLDIEHDNVYGATLGGLVGSAYTGYPNTMQDRPFQILNSYTAGTVRSESLPVGGSGEIRNVGGLIGYNATSWRPEAWIIENTYFLDDPGLKPDPGNNYGVPLSQTDMQNAESYVGWNFTGKWMIDPDGHRGLPQHRAAVMEVLVRPGTHTSNLNETHPFTVSIHSTSPTGESAEQVDWSVFDGEVELIEDPVVTVDENGLVTVTEHAEGKKYTIKATSQSNPTVIGTAELTVVTPKIVQISFYPYPQSHEPLAQGQTVPLTKYVNVVGNAPEDTTWDITRTDGKSFTEEDIAIVTIEGNDVLKIGANAPVGNYKVTLTSTFDPTKKYESTYTVAAPYIKSVIVYGNNSEVKQGASRTFVANVIAAGTASKDVNWSTTVPEATIENGVLVVSATTTPGSYQVRATSVQTPEKASTISVSILGVKSLTVSPNALTMERGQSKTLEVNVVMWPASLKPNTVTWSTDDTEGNIIVDPTTGKVTISEEAEIKTYTVKATSNYNPAFNGTATITVLDPITAVDVSPSSATILQGKKHKFDAKVISDNPDVNKAVLWSSNDPDAIEIDSNGEVTVKPDAEPGNYTIRATSVTNASKFGEATVTVTEISSMTLNESQVMLLESGEFQFEVDVQVVGDVVKTVTWSSVHPEAVSVDPTSGLVTVAEGATPGDYKIRATSTADTDKYVEATIKVVEVTGITVTPVAPGTFTVNQGKSVQLTANVAVTNGTASDVTWRSSDPDAVTVDANGAVTVVATAEAKKYTITATSKLDPTVEEAVEISVTAIAGIVVDPDSAQLKRGDTVELTANFTSQGEGEVDGSVTWSSDHSAVTVDANGNVKVTDTAPLGTYTITATSTVDTSKTGIAKIYVGEVTDVSLNERVVALLAGDTVELVAAVTADGPVDRSVEWTSSDSTGVTVNTEGKVQVLANAEVKDYTIRATSTFDASQYAEVTIKVAEVNHVKVTPAIAIVHQGKTQQLSAFVSVTNGTGPDVTWRSSDPVAVSVDNNGLVTVTATAEAKTYTVTATSKLDPSVSGEAEIHVTAVTDVAITPSTSFVLFGGTQQLNAEVTVVGAVYQTVTWSTYGTPISVNSSGLVTVPMGIEVGNYEVIATSTTDASKQGKALIIVGEVTGFTSQQSEVSLTAGESAQLSATAIVRGNIPDSVTWTSDSNEITVSESGLVTVSPNTHAGDYTVTATSTIDKMKFTTITIKVIEVTGVEVNPNVASLHRGGTQQLTATVSVVNGSDQRVTWSTSHHSVSVDSTGLVTVSANAAAGQYTITATSTADTSKQASATITVTVPTSSGGSGSTPDNGGTTPEEGDTKPEDGTTPEDDRTTPEEEGGTSTATGSEDAFNSHAIRVEQFVNKVEERVNAAATSNDEPQLTDTQNHWASATIDIFVKLNFVSGYEDGSFKPNEKITRAEFATIIYNIFDLNAGDRSVDLNDVDHHWAKTAIMSLAEAGIINGYGNGTFRPDQTINREEIVIILSRIINLHALEKDTTKGDFSDLDNANSYAVDIIKSAAQVGLINGKSNGKFDPQSEATRAEALTIILNALKLNPSVASILDKLSK